MKTKIRIFITVCAFVGVLNANATVNFEEKNSGLISGYESLSVLNEKIVSFESETNGSIDYQKEAQMVTRWIADMAELKATQDVMERGLVAPSETINSSENEVGYENILETTDFRKEAQIMIKQISDQEEAKVVQEVMERGFVAPNETISSSENEVGFENNVETTDFRREAQIMIKQIADQKEAKVVQEVMEKGFVAPNRTINSSENEVGYENILETTDFRKEAQIMIKQIADNEETKAVRKVIERGFVAPNETNNSFENKAGYENNLETTDFRREAQIMIKQIADNEETKAVRKVIEKGFVAPSETISSSENEVGFENNLETPDFRKEAQIMIKQIADQEEAKVVQKVMERGFVALSETTNFSENEVGYKTIFETTDFRKEAQIMIKQIADQEEAKAVQKVTVEDKLAENK